MKTIYRVWIPFQFVLMCAVMLPSVSFGQGQPMDMSAAFMLWYAQERDSFDMQTMNAAQKRRLPAAVEVPSEDIAESDDVLADTPLFATKDDFGVLKYTGLAQYCSNQMILRPLDTNRSLFLVRKKCCSLNCVSDLDVYIITDATIVKQKTQDYIRLPALGELLPKHPLEQCVIEQNISLRHHPAGGSTVVVFAEDTSHVADLSDAMTEQCRKQSLYEQEYAWNGTTFEKAGPRVAVKLAE